MSNPKNLLSCLAISILALLVASCSSDPNPVDYLNFDKESSSAKTLVQLTLNPSDTRAASTDENAISKVNLYIFDADSQKLEESFPNLPVTGNVVSTELSVEPGNKIIYAITASDIFSGVNIDNISLTDFEAKAFNSTLSKLITSNDYVMAGKSGVQNVVSSKMAGYVPDQNKFSIAVKRLVAKVQVKCADLTESMDNLGFSVDSKVYFKVFQTNNEMRLNSANGFLHSFTGMSNTSGTYSKYTFDTGSAYSQAQTSSYSTVNYQYMPENIVESPTSGNTTFVSVRLKVTPKTIWKYFLEGANNYLREVENTNVTYKSFWVAAFMKDGNVVDYYKSGNTIRCYSRDDDILSSSIDVPTGYTLEKLQITDGYIYYRINIKDNDADKYQVVRNKSYVINLQSIGSFGVPGESYLRPTDPTSQLDDNSVSAIHSDATFVVEDWSSDSENQNVNL